MDSSTSSALGRSVDAPFDLRGDWNTLGKKENMEYLKTIFPGTQGVFQDSMFLYIFMSHPPEPRPRVFAGVPVIFVTDPDTVSPGLLPPRLAAPPGFGVVPQQGSIAKHLTYGESHGLDLDLQCAPLLEAVKIHFVKIETPVTEIIYFGAHLLIVLKSNKPDKSILPFRAGGVVCRYVLETEMNRPAYQSELRHIDPKKRQSKDDTEYARLRPGIRVSSDYLNSSSTYRSSTLGCRVRDKDDKDFVTVAYRTFNEPGQHVYHPHRNSGRDIGWLAGRVGRTDIGLLSLAPTEQFSNEAFLSDGYDENDRSPQIGGLAAARRYDVVTLDSPDTGVIYGQIMGVAQQEILANSGCGEQEWAYIYYMYIGENLEHEISDSVCGSVIRGEGGKVVGFFQYYVTDGMWAGWCVGTSAEELLDRGFS
ncbi:hypothetical protein SEUCBS139899_007674 [Sporothrix eucalyptigena]